jgi:ketosteroid isomerase-like protein
MSDETRTKVDTVRAMFDSYLRQDRDLAERLLADEFVFTSPQDDHINRPAFFERCFPTANRLVRQDLYMWHPPTMTMYSSCTNTN